MLDARSKKATKFEFEGQELKMNPSFFLISSFNPGYAGRSNLPFQLKIFFRPNFLMVPDLTLIAIVKLYSNGIETAHKLGVKLIKIY